MNDAVNYFTQPCHAETKKNTWEKEGKGTVILCKKKLHCKSFIYTESLVEQ